MDNDMVSAVLKDHDVLNVQEGLIAGKREKRSPKKGRIPLAPMGVLAPVSAHAGPSTQPPIVTSGFFPPHVSAESPSNISPNPSDVISKVSEVYDKSFRIYLNKPIFHSK